jgi:hypothetical protein
MTAMSILDERGDFTYMSIRRFLALCALIVLFALLWNGFVHGILLREAEAALETFARPAAERSIVLALLLSFGIAVMFVISHAWLVRPAGLARGIAHGAYFGVLAGLLVDLNQYLVYPLPAGLAAGWFTGGLIEFSLYGLIAAWFCPFGEGRVPLLSKG